MDLTDEEEWMDSPTADRTSLERFDDQLLEEVLSFLTVRDKYRLECLSKKCQTLVFKRQRRLVLGSTADRNGIKWPVDRQRSDGMLRKLTALKDIDIQIDVVFTDGVKQIIDSVLENCPPLRRLSMRGGFSGLSFDELCRKSGKLLSELDVSRATLFGFDGQFSLTPNLRHLKTSDKLSRHLTPFLAISLPKLVDISVRRMTGPQMKTLAEKYHKQIRRLEVDEWFGGCQQELDQYLTQISRFENLDSLAVSLELVKPLALERSLEDIGLKCKRLKAVKLSVRYEIAVAVNISPKVTLFSAINHFKRLQALEVLVSVRFRPITDCLQLGPISQLTNCPLLRSLRLDLNGLTDRTFADIWNRLPNLRTIRLNDMSNELTDESLNSLSRVKTIKRLEIQSNGFSGTGIRHLVRRLPAIKVLSLKIEKSDENSIHSLLETAGNHPKTRFDVVCGDRQLCDNYNTFQSNLSFKYMKQTSNE